MLETQESLANLVAQCSIELEDKQAPFVGVHTLSEFVYCPRAGIISAESTHDDPGCEFQQAPSLGGLPMHDLDQIRNAIEQIFNQIKMPIAVNLGIWLVTLYFCLAFSPMLLLLFLPTLFFTGRWLVILLRHYQLLKQRLHIAENAAVQEPNWTLQHAQPINWWSLIRAGFVSVEKQESLFDEPLRIAGKPWRVLHRGSCVYPVLRIRVDGKQHDVRREGRLRQQQLARIAAYAYLLNRCERGDSSWAIVLFGWSDEGVAVPLTEHAWKTFRSGLIQARKELRLSQENPNNTPDSNHQTTATTFQLHTRRPRGSTY